MEDVGETNANLMALVGAPPEISGRGFLVPTRTSCALHLVPRERVKSRLRDDAERRSLQRANPSTSAIRRILTNEACVRFMGLSATALTSSRSLCSIPATPDEMTRHRGHRRSPQNDGPERQGVRPAEQRGRGGSPLCRPASGQRKNALPFRLLSARPIASKACGRTKNHRALYARSSIVHED